MTGLGICHQQSEYLSDLHSPSARASPTLFSDENIVFDSKFWNFVERLREALVTVEVHFGGVHALADYVGNDFNSVMKFKFCLM